MSVAKAPILSRQLDLLAATHVPDGAGGSDEIWQVRATLWAEMTARTGRAARAPHGEVGRAGWRARVRAQPVGSAGRPAAGMRFEEPGRRFVIESVAEDARHPRYLTCWCDEEVVP